MLKMFKKENKIVEKKVEEMTRLECYEELGEERFGTPLSVLQLYVRIERQKKKREA